MLANTVNFRSRAARSCFLLALLFGVNALAHAQQDAAFVINLKGKWVLNASTVLRPGSPLPASGTIRIQERQAGDFIEIADRGSKPIIIVKCDRENCSQPIRVPAAQNGVVSRVFHALVTILGRDPAKFVSPIVRAGGELNEAVVPIADGQVDLTAVFAGQRRGPYLVRFVPRGASAAPNAPMIGPVRVDWNPSKFALVTINGLNPGLYEVQLLSNEDREQLEQGIEAWALLVKPENFGDAFCEFREAQQLTKAWPESIDRSTKRQFLRVMLAKLESQ